MTIIRGDQSQTPSSRPSKTPKAMTMKEPEIQEDDLCPVCLMLLYEPVKTVCNHSLCRYCMTTWADTSPRRPQAPERLPPQDIAPHELEVNCPICRTHTGAQGDADRAALLEQTYPTAYAQRKAETEQSVDPEMEYLTLYIGNKHRSIETEDNNKHEWSFYVRTSREDIIHGVFVHLHPTFRHHHLMLLEPPFEIRRLGWGTFCIQAVVILKKRTYVWTDGENWEGRKFLRLHWTLDLSGIGSQHSYRFKIRPERPEDSVGWQQQYERELDAEDEDFMLQRVHWDHDDNNDEHEGRVDGHDEHEENERDDDDDDDDVDMTDAESSVDSASSSADSDSPESESPESGSQEMEPDDGSAITQYCWHFERNLLQELCVDDMDDYSE